MADQENHQEPVESAPAVEAAAESAENEEAATADEAIVDEQQPVEQPQSLEPAEARDSEGGPASMTGVGPPSPLTGCYLLIVIGEPHASEHKDIILQRLVKGLLSWDLSDNHVDLEDELSNLTSQAIEGEEGKHGERLIQFASENLVTEILIHPQFNTFIQCIRNLLSSFTRHRHIIHAGYTFAGNGSWILQDGTFSVSDFAEAFQDYEVQRVLRAYPDTITMDIHCAGNGLWPAIPDKNYAKTCKIRINPVDVLDSGSEKLNAFIDYLSPMVAPTEITDLLESSDVVGNIRFSHPTLYVFPGGQGDAALFGINGFNMLVDGGFSRKSCFWDFVRHLDRLDAVLMTRVNNSNISGLSSVIERKSIAHVYPQIGHFFTNIPDRRGLPSPDGEKDKDPLLIDLIEEGQKTITNLKTLNLKAQHCYRDSEPMNLYHKVGHGTLDMYVISPSKDSKEVKEFIQKWNNSDPKLFATKDAREFIFPLQNMVSICALLIWTPANPEDNVTRILFPGSTPQAKIFEGLDRIKSLEFLKTPVCTVKSLTTSTSSTIITKKVYKSGFPDKIQAEPMMPSKPISKPIERDNKAMEVDNKVIESKSTEVTKEEIKELVQETKKEQQVLKSMGGSRPKTAKSRTDSKRIENKIIKKVDPKDSDAESQEEKKNDEDGKAEGKSEKDSPTEPKKDDIDARMAKAKMSRPKTDSRVVARSRIDTKPPKALTERKVIAKKEEVIRSSPTTPKKTAEKKSTEDTKLANGSVVREIKKTVTRTVRASPKGTPAKSTKEANNRKVLESAQKAPIVKRDVTKQTKTERKPISHRTKAVSPGRKVGASPSKKPIKTEKDAVIRKSRIDKNGTTDSSLVSTPSADDAAKRVLEPSDTEVKVEDLEELKEEQEAVREIEAVFEREQGTEVTKKTVSEDHREIHDSATEAEEEEEYLIIEKEEPYTEDSINEAESSATKEEEIQKMQRDSEESEKRRKGSLEVTEEENEEEASEHEVEKEDGKSEKDQIQEQEDKAEEAAESDEKPEVPKDDEAEVEEEKDAEEMKEQLQEEVHEIITSAKEIAKSKLEAPDVKTEEVSSATPEEKLTSKKTSEKEDDAPVDGDAHQQGASQPEEKFSANAESGATTTAPTLPEDERCPLDEIKEDLVIEEKYVKEHTKESEVPSNVLHRVYEPLERQTPPKLPIETTVAPHLRDVVKTPDEVADLPVHEEADMGVYEDGRKSTDKELQGSKSKANEETDKEPEKTETKSVKPESDKICDEEDVTNKVLEAVNEQIETIKEVDVNDTTDETKVASPEVADEAGESSPKQSAGASPEPPKDNEKEEEKPRKESIAEKSQPASRKASVAAQEKSAPASRKASMQAASKPSSPDKTPPQSRKESLASSRKSSIAKDKAPSPEKSLPGSRKASISKVSSSKPSSPDKSQPPSRKASVVTADATQKSPEASQSGSRKASVASKVDSPEKSEAASRKASTVEEEQVVVSRKESCVEEEKETTPVAEAVEEICEATKDLESAEEPETAAEKEDEASPKLPLTPTTTPIEKTASTESPTDKEPSKTSSPIPSEETVETQIEEIKVEQETEHEPDQEEQDEEHETVKIISEVKNGVATVVGLQEIPKSKESSRAITPEVEAAEKKSVEDEQTTEQAKSKESTRAASPEAEMIEDKLVEDVATEVKAEFKESSRPISPEAEFIEDKPLEDAKTEQATEVTETSKDAPELVEKSSKVASPEPEKETPGSPSEDAHKSKEVSKPSSPVHDVESPAHGEEEQVETETVKVISEVKDGVATVVGLQEIPKSKDSTKPTTPEPEVEEVVETVESASAPQTTSPVEEHEHKVVEKSKESSKVVTPEPEVEVDTDGTSAAKEQEVVAQEEEKVTSPEPEEPNQVESTPKEKSKESSKVASPEPQEERKASIEATSNVIEETIEDATPEAKDVASEEPEMETETVKIISEVKDGVAVITGLQEIQVSKESSKAVTPEPEVESLVEAKVETIETQDKPKSKESSRAATPEPKEEAEIVSPSKEEKSKEASKVATPEPQEEDKATGDASTHEPDTKSPTEVIEASKPETPEEPEMETETVKIISEVKDGVAVITGLQEIQVSKFQSFESSKAVTPEPEADSKAVESEDKLKSKESSKVATPEPDVEKRASLTLEAEKSKESSKVATPEPDVEKQASLTLETEKSKESSKVATPEPEAEKRASLTLEAEKSKESSKVATPEPDVEKRASLTLETEKSKESSKVATPEPEAEKRASLTLETEKSKESSKVATPEPEAEKRASLTLEAEKSKESSKVATPEPEVQKRPSLTLEAEKSKESSKVATPEPEKAEQVEKSKESSKVATPEPAADEKATSKASSKVESPDHESKSGAESPKEAKEAEQDSVKIISEIKDGVATILGITTSGAGSKASSGIHSPEKSPSKTPISDHGTDGHTEIKANGEAIKMSEESFVHSASEQVEELVESIKSSAHHAVDFTKEDIKHIETEMKEAGEKIIETVKTEVASKVATAEMDSQIFKDEMQKVVDNADKAVKDLVETVQAEIVASSNLIDEQAESLETVTKKNISDVKSEAQSSIDKVRQELTDTKQEIEDLSKQTTAAAEQLKKDISAEIQRTMDSLQESAKKELQETQTHVTTGIGSFLGGLTKDIKAGLDKVTTSIESTISSKVEEIEKKVESIAHDVDDIEPKIVPTIMKEVTTEIRETHITTVDSPVKEPKVLEDLQEEPETMTSSFRIEEIKYDSGLDEIKEVEEEDRCSPPSKQISSPKLTASPCPLRPRTPEEVQKIVAEVAEVLKSDKDITEIIPDFDEKELERRLSQKSDDGGSVHRMLLTASSEDGGGETEICPHDTINFDRAQSPELSGKSSPEIRVDLAPDIDQNGTTGDDAETTSPDQDHKTSPASFEEKEKHEVSEKVLAKQEIVSKVESERKESIVSELVEPDRRESTFSTFSEKDITRDESSIEEQKSQESRPHSVASHISDIKDEGHDVHDHDVKPQSDSGEKSPAKTPTDGHAEEKEEQEKSSFMGEEVEADKFPPSKLDQSSRQSENLEQFTTTSSVAQSATQETRLIQEAPNKFPVTVDAFDQELQQHEDTKGGFPIGTVDHDDQTPDSDPKEQTDAKPFDASQKCDSPDEPIVIKESRSKSVSAIITTAPYKLEKEFLDDTRKLPALAESISSSHESLARSTLSLARDSIDISKFPITEETKEEISTTTVTETVVEKTETVALTPEPDVSGVSGKQSPDVTSKSVDIKSTEVSEKSSGTLEKDSIDGSQTTGNTTIEKDSLSLDSSKTGVDHLETVVSETTQTITTTTTVVEETVVPEISTTITETSHEIIEELTGRKTPPTAPVSPNIKTEATQKESIEELRKESLTSAVSSIHGSTESVARSIPMSIGGQESGIETPESSPKPTAPFPKGLEALKTEEGKTSSGMSTPDMTRTSTPDEITHIESVDGTKTITKTVVTTTTTVITKGGETVVSEKTVTEMSSDVDDTPETVQKVTVHTLPQEYQSITIHKSSASDHSRDHESEDEGACSAMSTSPQPPASPYTTKFNFESEYERSSSASKKMDIDDESQYEIPPQYDSAITLGSSTFKSDPMSTSFYGSLPDVEPQTQTTSSSFTTQFVETVSSPIEIAEFRRKSSDKYFDEADLDFDKVMTSDTPESKEEQGAQGNKEKKADETLASWGKPLGLPSPALTPAETDNRTTPKKERKQVAAKTKLNNEKNLRKRGESPASKKRSPPVYVDLAYVPHHGNSYYSHVEYFRRIRARYYVFSGTEPSREVYNALLEAKQTWEDKELEVTIIPTYDTDVLGYWVSENEELLTKYHIDLSPSAARCTINLQDHETSCSAYRLEF